MSNPIESITQWWVSLNLREKILITVALLATFLGLIDLVYLSPQQRNTKALRTQSTANAEKLKTLRPAVSGLENNAQRMTGQIKQLRAEVDQMRQQAQALTDGMVGPEDMLKRLQETFPKHSRLRLAGLRTLPAAPLVSDAATGMYKHPIVIQVSGDYLALFEYLQALKRMDFLHWDQMLVNADAYPVISLELEAFTVSGQTKWLSL